MQAANVEKTLGMLKKPFTALPMATDLPRLTNLRLFDRSTEIVMDNPTNATTTDRLLFIFSTLALLLFGQQAKEDVEKKFKEAGFSDEAAASATLSKAQVDNFIQSIGGDESPLVMVLKAVNQVAISPAVIELKMVLGMGNMTKDVRNSWIYTIHVNEDTVIVTSRKREQCIKNLFQIEWVLQFTFDRTSMYKCTQVKLTIEDLLFHADLHLKPEKFDKKEEIKRLLRPYTTDEVLKASETKTWEFFTVEDKAKKYPDTNKISAEHKDDQSSTQDNVQLKTISTTYSNGDKYEGQINVATGLRHGRGIYTSASGFVYNGEYKDGVRHGAGDYKLQTGAIYSGKFENGNIVSGSFVFPNGDKYEGTFIDGVFSGKGRFTRADGSETYDGTFKAGQRNGHGVAIINRTDKYEGMWINDLMQGPGKYTYANGDVFTGTFKEGKPHGVGEYRFSVQKKVAIVEFKDGKLVNVHSVKGL